MHNTVKNLLDIDNNIKVHLNKLNITNHPKIIAVSKTFKIDKILPLIEHGHINYGENKVQEAVEKWTEVKKTNSNLSILSTVKFNDELLILKFVNLISFSLSNFFIGITLD